MCNMHTVWDKSLARKVKKRLEKVINLCHKAKVKNIHKANTSYTLIEIYCCSHENCDYFNNVVDCDYDYVVF